MRAQISRIVVVGTVAALQGTGFAMVTAVADAYRQARVSEMYCFGYYG